MYILQFFKNDKWFNSEFSSDSISELSKYKTEIYKLHGTIETRIIFKPIELPKGKRRGCCS